MTPPGQSETGIYSWTEIEGRGGVKVKSVYLQQVVQGVLPGLGEELLLDTDERSFPQTLQTNHHT